MTPSALESLILEIATAEGYLLDVDANGNTLLLIDEDTDEINLTEFAKALAERMEGLA